MINYRNPEQLFAFKDELDEQRLLYFFGPLYLVANRAQAKFYQLHFVRMKCGKIAILVVVGYLLDLSIIWRGLLDQQRDRLVRWIDQPDRQTD